MSDKDKAFKYKRYMRDGSIREITAVVRSKRPKKQKEKSK